MRLNLFCLIGRHKLDLWGFDRKYLRGEIQYYVEVRCSSCKKKIINIVLNSDTIKKMRTEAAKHG